MKAFFRTSFFSFLLLFPSPSVRKEKRKEGLLGSSAVELNVLEEVSVFQEGRNYFVTLCND